MVETNLWRRGFIHSIHLRRPLNIKCTGFPGGGRFPSIRNHQKVPFLPEIASFSVGNRSWSWAVKMAAVLWGAPGVTEAIRDPHTHTRQPGRKPTESAELGLPTTRCWWESRSTREEHTHTLDLRGTSEEFWLTLI